jgi:multicomponent Na+:H+ antiporter subunit F
VSAEFLAAAAGFIMITVIVGLARILYGPGDADRIMAAQLLGTGGIAAMLLVGVSRGLPAAIDVALTLAVLAAFASIAFVKYASPANAVGAGPDEGQRGRDGDGAPP